MTCIYHSRDFDGLCSGKILQEAYPDAKMIGYDYGQPVPELDTHNNIIMADVTFPMEDMIRIGRECQENNALFTVIDHHVSFAKQVTELSEVPFQFVYDKSISACEAVWIYFSEYTTIPRGIRLLGKYDTWRQGDDWDSDVLPFQYGLRAYTNNINSFPSTNKLSNASWVNSVIEIGRSILDYQALQNEKACIELAFEAEFKGLRAICLNTTVANSQAFDSVWNEENYDLMICFRYNGRIKQWVYSLYTTKEEVDCSVLAKQMGGGGHKKAAGFQHNDFILTQSH